MFVARRAVFVPASRSSRLYINPPERRYPSHFRPGEKPLLSNSARRTLNFIFIASESTSVSRRLMPGCFPSLSGGNDPPGLSQKVPLFLIEAMRFDSPFQNPLVDVIPVSGNSRPRKIGPCKFTPCQAGTGQ